MRVSRKNRQELNGENIVSSVDNNNQKLDKFQTLQQTGNLLKPVKNTDSIVEMDEAEYLRKFNIKTETFKEQACRVLTILDKQGVNIYSEDNTPGMYLRQKGQNISPAGLSNLFRKKNKQSEDETSSISNELKNFFKSKNK